MSGPSLQAQVDAANAYEALFVPALFRQWATKVADAAQIQPGERVLDVACGTGILAREVASRTGPEGFVAALDPNLGMLSVAEQLAPGVQWRQSTAESIPFADGYFDAVVSQFGLMFFTDRTKALREMLRVLLTGGRLVVAVWSSLDDTPVYASLVALLERVAGRPAADALRAPFVLGHRKVLADLFADAGVVSAEMSTQRGVARFPGIKPLVEAELRGWLPVMGVVLTEDQIDRILRDAEDVLRPWVAENGEVVFDLPAHIVRAKKH